MQRYYKFNNMTNTIMQIKHTTSKAKLVERTEILCPECMKKKLLTATQSLKDENQETWCDECGTEFIITTPNTVIYR